MTNTPGGARVLKHKRRYCRSVGCTKIVKSQGLCQKHGAKPRMCKIGGCGKQAQGNFNGMCKSHFKAHKQGPSIVALPAISEEDTPILSSSFQPDSRVKSVWDRILPASVGWKPNGANKMPLLDHLELGSGTTSNKPSGWHRNEERSARGLPAIAEHEMSSAAFEPWELDLCGKEILLLTGTTECEAYWYLARAWGQPHGFHEDMAANAFGEQQQLAPDAGENDTADCHHHYRYHDKSDSFAWDDETAALICGDLSYIETLAANLFDFDEENKNGQSVNHHHHDRTLSLELIDNGALQEQQQPSLEVGKISHWEL